MLLDPNQRIGRAGNLIAASLAVALLNQGWVLNLQPGLFYLGRGEAKLHPFRIVNDPMKGPTSAKAASKTMAETWAEDWRARCRDLGISDLKVGIVPAPTAGT